MIVGLNVTQRSLAIFLVKNMSYRFEFRLFPLTSWINFSKLLYFSKPQCLYLENKKTQHLPNFQDCGEDQQKQQIQSRQIFTMTTKRQQKRSRQGMLPAIPILQGQAISHCCFPQLCALRGIQDGEKCKAFCSLDTGPTAKVHIPGAVSMSPDPPTFLQTEKHENLQAV